MKKKCQITYLLIVLILKVFTPAFASVELDRRYTLEVVGSLGSWDNVDNLFLEYVDEAFVEYFDKQSRFRQTNLNKVNKTLMNSKLPYKLALEDYEILQQIAKTANAQSLFRTFIVKEGNQYKFSIDWLHAPRMELLGNAQFLIEESSDKRLMNIVLLKKTIHEALEGLVKKIPFYGHITGRDAETVTINIGSQSGLLIGDIVDISTIEEVEIHPLLKTVVNWKFRKIGRLEIEEVDENMSFGRIIEEDKSYPIARFQKVTAVLKTDKNLKLPELPKNGEKIEESLGKSVNPVKQAKIGWASAGIWGGTLSREYSMGSASIGKTGGGFLIGAKGHGQVWINRDYYFETQLGYGSTGYSQKDIATGVASSATTSTLTTRHYKVGVGYSYLGLDSLQDTKGTIEIGYLRTSYSMLSDAASYLGLSSFAGPYLGLGADLPLSGGYGAMLQFNFGVLTKGSTLGLVSNTPSSTSQVLFSLGSYYQYKPGILLKVMFELTAQSADFSDQSALSQKVTSIIPSLVFLF